MVNSATLTVQWGRVPCIHQNGDITGYSVRYQAIGNGAWTVINVTEESINETRISNLNSSTNYSIQVAAINSAGTGTYSSSVFFTTPQG